MDRVELFFRKMIKKLKANNKIFYISFFLLVLFFCNIDFRAEATSENAVLHSDQIEYDATSGIIKGIGNIKFQSGDIFLKGDYASYNLKEKHGIVRGHVHAQKGNITFFADTVEIIGDKILKATGNVSFTFQGKKVLTPIATYDSVEEILDLPKGGTIMGEDATLTSDELRGNLKDEYFTARGHVHIVHRDKNIEAGSDSAEYFLKMREKVILRHNAWIIEENNTLKSEEITFYLDNHSTGNKG